METGKTTRCVDLNKNPRPKGRGIGIPGTGEGTPQAAGNLPAMIKNLYKSIGYEDPISRICLNFKQKHLIFGIFEQL